MKQEIIRNVLRKFSQEKPVKGWRSKPGGGKASKQEFDFRPDPPWEELQSTRSWTFIFPYSQALLMATQRVLNEKANPTLYL